MKIIYKILCCFGIHKKEEWTEFWDTYWDGKDEWYETGKETLCINCGKRIRKYNN